HQNHPKPPRKPPATPPNTPNSHLLPNLSKTTPNSRERKRGLERERREREGEKETCSHQPPAAAFPSSSSKPPPRFLQGKRKSQGRKEEKRGRNGEEWGEREKPMGGFKYPKATLPCSLPCCQHTPTPVHSSPPPCCHLAPMHARAL